MEVKPKAEIIPLSSGVYRIKLNFSDSELNPQEIPLRIVHGKERIEVRMPLRYSR